MLAATLAALAQTPLQPPLRCFGAVLSIFTLVAVLAIFAAAGLDDVQTV